MASSQKRNLPPSPAADDKQAIEPPSAKKPRRSGRHQAKEESEDEIVPNTPPTPLLKNGLSTPIDSSATKTGSVTPKANRSSPPVSPSQNFEATQLATQVASQFHYPTPDTSDVWGYLIPVGKEVDIGEVMILKQRSGCAPDEPDMFRRGKKDKCPGKNCGGCSNCNNKRGGRPSGYLLGRHAECDFRLTHPTVSNWHCVIFKETSGSTPKAIIEDRSTNGTFVNGAKVGRNNRRDLLNGDEITLGDGPQFMFRYPSSQPSGSFLDNFELPANGTLGSGHFATVHVCIEKSTGTKYAVKIFKKRRKDEGRGQLGLEQEIAVLMSVHHENVLCLKETYEEDEGIYLVLELASEGELFNLIIDRGKLSESDTRRIFVQLLQGLKYLHERSIVHRDIKPENILLTDKNLTVKLADFGLAKIIGEDSFTTSLCGTPSYVAPEILMPSRSRKYSRAVDIWSFGVVLYICLCGFPPFSDELAPPNLRDQIKEGRFDYPSPYWDSIGDSALDLIDRMLTVDPEQRITVEEALEHPWILNKPFNPAMSTDSDASLAGHMEGLAMRRKVGRERTLLTEQVRGHAIDKYNGAGKPNDDGDGTKAFMKLGPQGAEDALYSSE